MAETLVPTTSEIIDPKLIGKNYVGASNVGPLGSFGKPFRYGFVLLDGSKADQTITDGKQVVLNLAPQSITMSEPAATTIQPTQNSGKYVERRGQIIKDIVIAGTTAFNYEPRIPHQARFLLPQSEIITAEGPTSGMGRFLELRNLFREYWAVFSDKDSIDDGAATRARFVFVNEKDDESWLVEPMNFRMIRSAPRNKFTYNYEIIMQTIMMVEDIPLKEDPLTLAQKANNYKSIARNISDNLLQYSAVISRGMSFATGALRTSIGSVTSKLNTIASGLTLIADGTKNILEVPELFASGGRNVEASYKSAAERFLDIRDATTLSNGVDPVPDIGIDSGFSSDTQDALTLTVDEALTNSLNDVGRLAGRQELFNEEFSDTWSDLLDRYDPNYGFGGFNRTLTDAVNYNGVRESTINPGDDIFNIAIKELGDAERFQEIVLLNGLRPPYISPTVNDRQANTLAPGDPILVPVLQSASTNRTSVRTTVFSDPTFTAAVITGSANTVTIDTEGRVFRTNQWAGFTIEVIDGAGLGQTRKIDSSTSDTMTVDKDWDSIPTASSIIRITLVRIGGEVSIAVNEQVLGTDIKFYRGDAIVSTQGDLELVRGTENLIQAIETKFSTRPGELFAHPEFGLTFEPGRRATVDTLLTYRVAAKQLLRSDPRIAGVDQFTVTSEGDILRAEGYALVGVGPKPFAINTRS